MAWIYLTKYLPPYSLDKQKRNNHKLKEYLDYLEDIEALQLHNEEMSDLILIAPTLINFINQINLW